MSLRGSSPYDAQARNGLQGRPYEISFQPKTQSQLIFDERVADNSSVPPQAIVREPRQLLHCPSVPAGICREGTGMVGTPMIKRRGRPLRTTPGDLPQAWSWEKKLLIASLNELVESSALSYTKIATANGMSKQKLSALINNGEGPSWRVVEMIVRHCLDQGNGADRDRDDELKRFRALCGIDDSEPTQDAATSPVGAHSGRVEVVRSPLDRFRPPRRTVRRLAAVFAIFIGVVAIIATFPVYERLSAPQKIEPISGDAPGMTREDEQEIDAAAQSGHGLPYGGPPAIDLIFPAAYDYRWELRGGDKIETRFVVDADVRVIYVNGVITTKPVGYDKCAGVSFWWNLKVNDQPYAEGRADLRSPVRLKRDPRIGPYVHHITFSVGRQDQVKCTTEVVWQDAGLTREGALGSAL
jgi:hypothetical protein